jgi:hypothetical protein
MLSRRKKCEISNKDGNYNAKYNNYRHFRKYGSLKINKRIIE